MITVDDPGLNKSGVAVFMDSKFFLLKLLKKLQNQNPKKIKQLS